MALVNTTVIPLDKKTLTEEQYQNLVKQQYQDLIDSDKIIMVILGNSDTIIKAVDKADLRADSSPGGFTRWVMWVGNHMVLKDKLEVILNTSGIIQDGTPYEEIKAFCLTQSPRKANTRVHKNGTLDNVQILQLFTEAEAQSL